MNREQVLRISFAHKHYGSCRRLQNRHWRIYFRHLYGWNVAADPSAHFLFSFLRKLHSAAPPRPFILCRFI